MGGADGKFPRVASHRPVVAKMQVYQSLKPGNDTRSWRFLQRVGAMNREGRLAQKQPGEGAQNLCAREVPAGEYAVEPGQCRSQISPGIEDHAGGQVSLQSLFGAQAVIHHLARQCHNESACSGLERESVYGPHGQVDGAHRRKRVGVLLDPGLPAALLHQHDLVQPVMAMRGKFPVMQGRARLDRFAMRDIGKLAVLAKQVIGPDAVRAGWIHVRNIPVMAARVHVSRACAGLKMGTEHKKSGQHGRRTP